MPASVQPGGGDAKAVGVETLIPIVPISCGAVKTEASSTETHCLSHFEPLYSHTTPCCHYHVMAAGAETVASLSC